MRPLQRFLQLVLLPADGPQLSPEGGSYRFRHRFDCEFLWVFIGEVVEEFGGVVGAREGVRLGFVGVLDFSVVGVGHGKMK